LGNHLDLHGARYQLAHLRLQPLVDALLHAAAAREDEVLLLLLASLDVHAFDRCLDQLLDGLLLAVDGEALAQLGVEHDLGALLKLLAELDDLLVGQFDVDLVLLAAVLVGIFLRGVHGDLAVLLLDLLDELLLVRLVQADLGGATDECAHGLSHGSACHRVLGHGHLVDVAIDHRHGVAHAIAHVQHGPGGFARGEEG